MKKWFYLFKPKTAEQRRLAESREEKARAILLSELNQRRTDGKAISHRRLESLMLASGTGRRETVRLLRKLGARPSATRGTKWWTLE